MSRVLFVEPDTIKLPLFDDGAYWIEVKQQLNAGESKRLSQGAFQRVSPTGGGADALSLSFDLNLEAAAFAKVLLYLVDWNLIDKSGKTVVIDTPKARQDALKALMPNVFAEIERVIDDHAMPRQKKAMSSNA